jgi:hypothetical protein
VGINGRRGEICVVKRGRLSGGGALYRLDVYPGWLLGCSMTAQQLSSSPAAGLSRGPQCGDRQRMGARRAPEAQMEAPQQAPPLSSDAIHPMSFPLMSLPFAWKMLQEAWFVEASCKCSSSVLDPGCRSQLRLITCGAGRWKRMISRRIERI